MEKINYENSNEESKINIREQENGDVFFISGLSEDELLEVAISICKNLDKSILPHELKREDFLSGNAIRPGGCFAVRYDGNRNELCVDNRNARGVEEVTQKLKQAVYLAIQENNK